MKGFWIPDDRVEPVGTLARWYLWLHIAAGWALSLLAVAGFSGLVKFGLMHSYPVRVYYEDTDLSGLVYHANYLKFIERARSDWVRGLGIDQMRLRDRGTVFAVRRIEADYRAPARFDDLLEVTTALRTAAGARLTLAQTVLRGDTALFAALVTLVALDPGGRAIRLPAELREALR